MVSLRQLKLQLVLALALWSLDQCSPLTEDLYLVEHEERPDHRVLVIVMRTEEEVAVRCAVFTNTLLVEEIVLLPIAYRSFELSEEEFQNVLAECDNLYKHREKRQSNDKRNSTAKVDCNSMNKTNNISKVYCENHNETTDEAEQMWNIIFPGTKWCGAGNIAKDYNDLGVLRQTDMCCRAHDNCNDTILAGETGHNLTNDSPFTSLSCDCDDAFYNCLSEVDTIFSNTIGGTYFNLLRRNCFYKDYPQTSKCKTYRSFLHLSCKEHEKNTTAPPIYMWRSPKTYTKFIPIG